MKSLFAGLQRDRRCQGAVLVQDRYQVPGTSTSDSFRLGIRRLGTHAERPDWEQQEEFKLFKKLAVVSLHSVYSTHFAYALVELSTAPAKTLCP